MLRVEGLEAGYGTVRVLHGVRLEVAPSSVTCLMGRNGAGKTTLLRAIMGLVPARAGRITADGRSLESAPVWQRPAAGLAYVPQGRRLFAGLSVAENIEIGLRARARPAAERAALRQRLLARFPRLGERLGQAAETLSGGEQQMLAIARALAVEPRYILLDEPSEGLQPSMVALVENVVREMASEGIGVLLVEQRAAAVSRLADRVQFIENGRTPEPVAAAAVTPDHLHRYLGV